MPRISLIFLTVLAIGASTVGANIKPQGEVLDYQFKHWYPQFGQVFESLIENECEEDYDRYLRKESRFVTEKEMYEAGADRFTLLTQPLADCLLNNTSEFVKGTMTSAQVLLGIMPTVLVLLGASVDEVAMLANVGRRPLLAFLLGFASPACHFSRAFHYADPAEILGRHELRQSQFRPSTWRSKLPISLLEYIIALALGAQVLHCAYEIGYRAISFISSETTKLPLMWVWTGAVVQLFGVFVFRLRVQGWRDTPDECAHQARSRENRQHRPQYHRGLLVWLRGIWQRIKGLVRTEPHPCAASTFDVRFSTFKETKLFLFAAWFQSVATVIHVILGTLIYSSMMFVGSKDAVIILCRFIVPTIICRVIIMYEIAGLRESCVTHTLSEVKAAAQEREYQLSQIPGIDVCGLKHRTMTMIEPVLTKDMVTG